MALMELIVEKLAKEGKVSERTVGRMIDEITAQLIKEGCEEDEPRFMQYLIRRVRKRLKIEESSTLKSFRQFFQKM